MENENNQQNINFNAQEQLPVVEVEPQIKNNKNKIPVIIVICLLVVALVAGIIIFATQGNEKEPVENLTEESTDDYQDLFNSAMAEVITDESGSEISRDEYVTQLNQQLEVATTTITANVGSESPNIIEEKTTVNTPDNAEPTTVNTHLSDRALKQIEAFFNRRFFMEGAMYANGDGDSVSMAFDGNNFEALTNLDGIEVSMLYLDNVLYIKRPAVMQYVEMTESLMEMMELNPADLQFNFGGAAGYEEMKSKLTATYDITVNGEAGICHVFRNNGNTFKFYSADGNVKQIEIYNADGDIVSQFTITRFSTAIPSDKLTLKGYEKTGIGTLFADIFAQEG